MSAADRLTPVVRLAPAKVNLTLAVVGRRDDGFHDLHSVFVPLELADRLSLAPAGAGATSADTLHVDATTAACFLNGTQVATVAVTPGELDGHPGVQVGANGDVLVMMFTVVGSRELFVT